MKVALIGNTEEEARIVAARLGMVQTAQPLRAGVSPLLGHRFTAVVLCPGVKPSTVTTSESEWWQTLARRVQPDSPTLRLEYL